MGSQAPEFLGILSFSSMDVARVPVVQCLNYPENSKYRYGGSLFKERLLIRRGRWQCSIAVH